MNNLAPGTELPVMEAFYTLQGEGAFTGQAAWFIRLGGCDVGCVWCDVKESWDASAHPKVKIDDLVKQAAEKTGRIAVITGGEPLLHPLGPLTESLRSAGFRTHMETSGSSPLSGNWDWITLSPKKFKAPLPEVLLAANEFKVVVYHPSDLEWAQSFRTQLNPSCLLYLQPEWSKKEQMEPLIIDFIQQHPEWRMSLQTHKYLQIP